MTKRVLIGRIQVNQTRETKAERYFDRLKGFTFQSEKAILF